MIVVAIHQPNYASWLGYVHNPCGRDILEGLAAGKPMISIGRNDRFVETGVTGVLLPEYSAEAFANALVGLDTDREIARRLGADARRRIAALCDGPGRASDLAKSWRDAIEARAA